MRTAAIVVVALSVSAAACGPSGPAKTADRGSTTDNWLARAKQSYKGGDFDDARDAVQSVLRTSRGDPEARLIAARVALARLEFVDVLRLTEGLDTSDAHGLRGRAHWYAGDIEEAADELEASLRDPAVRDPWAREVARLARRGQGRHPFALEGSMVAAVEMPRAGPALVVPCELEGEDILGLVATATAEVVVDSSSRKEPAWVNLRFANRIEVKDVPALTQDLSALSRQFGAPIKALFGNHLLRHLHVTFDRRGDQFVVRRADPPAPPQASRVPVWYVRGGGMLVQGKLGARDEARGAFLVDSSAFIPMALEDAGWKKAGMDPAKLTPEPNVPGSKSGIVPMVKLGAFELPRIPALYGLPMGADARASLDVDVDGVLGAGLLSLFRITLADEGRFMWIEPDPTLEGPTPSERGQVAPQGPTPPPPRPGPRSPLELTPPTPAPKPMLPTKPGASP